MNNGSGTRAMPVALVLATAARAVGPFYPGVCPSPFWRSFFRYDSSSWGSQLTGWILTFFPYIATASEPLASNPYLKGWEEACRKAEQLTGRRVDLEGPVLEALPGSLASAPVRFVDLRDHSEMPVRFVADLWGVTQDSLGALMPEFGWAVIDDQSR